MIKIGVDARGIFTNPLSGHARTTISLYQKLLKFSEFQFIFYSSPVTVSLNTFFPGATNAKLKVLDPRGTRILNYETIWTELALPFALWQDQIAILHSPINRLPRFLTCQSVSNIYDLATLDYHPTLSPEVLKKHYRRVIENSTIVTTCSEFSRQSLLKLAPHINPDRLITIPLAAPEFSPLHETSITPITEPYFLALGQNNHPRKNIPNIIKSFGEFKRQTNQPIKLLIIGITEDQAKNELNKIIEDHQLTKDILIKGFLSDSELNRTYQQAIALIYLSTYEGFGLPILEAMQAECPVIAANSTAIPETASNAAILVDPNSPSQVALALKQILEDSTLRKDLIAKGKINLQKFSWEKSANKLNEIFRKLASR